MKNLLIQAFDEPNHTQTPNKFFDMIPDMSEAELRVTLVMIRHTLGYHKNTFKMGMQKLGDAGGLTRQGAMAGAEAAEKRGIFKRSNPDSQKEAEWELNLLPVNVDDMSTSFTPSVNVDDTRCNLGLPQVGVKESIKEKEINDNSSKPAKPDFVDGYIQMSQSPGLKAMARRDAILSALGSAFALNTSGKKWETLARFVDDRQAEGQSLTVFIAWLKAQPGFDVSYWPPAKMEEHWPRAFIMPNLDNQRKEGEGFYV